MEKPKHTLSLGRVSPPVKESVKRFNGLMGPAPGNVRLDDLAIDTDFYGLPLSPTNLTTTNKSFPKLSPRKDSLAFGSKKQDPALENLQSGLKGTPKMAGLTSYEYAVDGSIKYHCSNFDSKNVDEDMISRYKNIFQPDSNVKSKEMMEIQINLPFQTMIEQIELKFSKKLEIYSKYLKIAGVTRYSVLKNDSIERESGIGQDIQMTVLGENLRKSKYFHLKSGYFDQAKKTMEMNMVGAVTHQVNIQFEFDIDQIKLPKNSNPSHFSYDEASELDDLDSEVQNITGKNHSGREDLPIKHEEIKIQMQEEQKVGLKQQFDNNGEETRIFEGTNTTTWATKLLSTVLQSIKIVGFNTNKIPAITNLAHLMNCSFYLRKEKINLEDALEVDFMQGTLLISSKRNTQAVELLRNKVQAPYLKQIESNLQKLQNCPVDSRENLRIQTKKLFTRAAIIELMCSESMCIRPQLNEKLESLKRMTQLCRGQQVKIMPFSDQIFMADDEYTTMVKILPYMLKFTIKCIENNQQCNREIVIVSALRNIQFILETQGCSLDSAMIVILKSLFKNYPDRIKQEKIQRKVRDFKEKMESPEHPGKTLLAGRIGGGMTCSANELNQANGMDFNSQKEMAYKMLNKNSARGSGAMDQKIEDSVQKMKEFPKNQKMSMIESIFSLSWIQMRDEPQQKKEPNSGFEKTLVNLFNHLLETYISVLSSISSHILHQIFYEVIVPCLINQPFEDDDESDFSYEVKIFAVKIAEKIITICQGDLIMNRSLLDSLVKSQSAPSFKKQLEMTGASEQLRGQMKNLWASIRTKVFTNYSMKGFKQLIEWLVSKMSLLAQNCTILDGKSSASEIAMLELSDEDLLQLSQYLEIITFISVGRRQSQDEANSLIKIKQDYCMDLYLLLNPLLFWLDFSVEREERLNIFKQVYQTIKDVLENLPPKKVDIDILQIIIPILQRTSEYLLQNSPTQSMLKFLDIVLLDIKQGKYCQTNYPDLQYFFLGQLNSIVNSMSYCLYEEIFPVFDKLLSLSQDVMTERILKKCMMALIDKYTMKNKSHKQSIQVFMKSLMEINIDQESKKSYFKEKNKSNHELMDIFDQDIDIADISQAGKKDNKEINKPTRSNFFEVMLDYCFFENDDEPALVAAEVLKSSQFPSNIDDSIIRTDLSLQFRSPHDLHELYIDKLQFFIDALNLMGERHVNLFNSLVFSPKFKSTIFGLLNKGETNLRLKCHEILEIVGTYYIQFCSSKTLYELAVPTNKPNVQSRRAALLEKGFESKDFEMMEVDFINHERMYISQMIIQCVRKSFEMNNGNDSYMQFNSLILLDYLFQNILPVPSFQNEQLKARQNQENQKAQQKNQMDRNREAAYNDSELEMEDGSSGGDCTTRRAAAAAAAARNRAQSNDENRQFNSNYIGSLEDGIDLETVNISERIPELEVTDPRYTAMRLKLVYKLWPYVQEALNSPWSNIRSICYGLICSMLKIDVKDCTKYLPYQSNESSDLNSHQIEIRLSGREERKQKSPANDEKVKEYDDKDKELLENNKYYLKLRQFVIPMMINLLSSKESESKAGGLNILGSICGLSYDFSKVKISRNLDFFKRNSDFVSLPIWQLVFELQDDWDITIKEASIVLIQLCAPREAIKYFNKCKVERENLKFQQMLNKMAKNGGGQGGHGSMSNLSSARQNSLYNHINSKKSFNDQGDQSQRRIDYKNVDFGYKNKAIPNIPGLMNEFGKLDMATFLNDNQDLMNIDDEEKKSDKQEKPLALNLDKIYKTQDQKTTDIDAVMLQSSLSQRSGFGNQQILLQSQQQNQNLTKAMQGSHPSEQSQAMSQQFDFFVDDYCDEQIQEIISIFRNDFKPPKNLWIEKAVESSIFNGPDFYADIYSQAIEQFNQQQMMLQQKQQQELQDQVSGGSSSPQSKAGEFSPPGFKEEDLHNINIQEKQESQGPIQPEKKSQREPEVPFIQPEEKKDEKFDPTDLNIFEQINFDEMNINLEDINQSNQKQDIINSSNSDIGDQGGDSSVEYPLLSSGGQNLQQILISNQQPNDIEAAYLANEILDTCNDMEMEIIPYEEIENNTISYNKIGGIGTELQVIESISNEVSSGSRQNSHNNNTNLEVIDYCTSRVSNDESEKTDEKYPINIQDNQLDQFEKRNNKTLKMIQQEKRKEEIKPHQQQSTPPIQSGNQMVEYPLESIQAKTQVLDMSKYRDIDLNNTKKNNSSSTPDFQSKNAQLQLFKQLQENLNSGRNEPTVTAQKSHDSDQPKKIPKYPNTQNFNTQDYKQSKQQILKNFKQIKTNNEDYIIMQNISNQMGGQIINTTKNKLSIENIFKKPSSKTSNGTSQGRLKPASQKIGQSQDLSLALNKKQRGGTASKNVAQTHRNTQGQFNKYTGSYKKTTSISPKRPQNEITKLLMGNNQGSSNFNSTQMSNGGQRKSQRSNGGGTINVNQPLSSNQQNNHKKIKENMRDMNYFIKTIEKFSKNSKINMEVNQKMLNKATDASAGELTNPGSDPQTPMDVLMNMGDQLHKLKVSKNGSQSATYNTTQPIDTKQSRKMTNKFAPTAIAAHLYEQMLSQQQKSQKVQADTAESLKSQLKKNGFNIQQLNKILAVETKGRKYELTPDSTGNNYRPIAIRNGHSKSSKSNGSYPGLSQSPQNLGFKIREDGSVDSGSRPNNRPLSGTSGNRKLPLDTKTQRSKKFSSNQPHPNLMLMNYSQTQKFDLREINKQLMAGFKQGGSTQNKTTQNGLIVYNSNIIHSQREKSAESNGRGNSQYNNLMISNQGRAQVGSPQGQKVPVSARAGATIVSDLKGQKIPTNGKR